MKTVATPWNRLAKFLLLLFAIPFSLIGVVMYIVLDGNWALLINGVLWLLVGLGFLVKGYSEQRKLERLKKEGLHYDGSVVKVIPAHWVRTGSYITARVECAYRTEKIDSLVKSGYHLLSPFEKIENLHAKIYLDRNDPVNYAVELFRED